MKTSLFFFIWGCCFFVFFFSRTRNQKDGGEGDETEEWATAGLVSVRTLNFDWLEAWPEAF